MKKGKSIAGRSHRSRRPSKTQGDRQVVGAGEAAPGVLAHEVGIHMAADTEDEVSAAGGLFSLRPLKWMTMRCLPATPSPTSQGPHILRSGFPSWGLLRLAPTPGPQVRERQTFVAAQAGFLCPADRR